MHKVTRSMEKKLAGSCTVVDIHDLCLCKFCRQSVKWSVCDFTLFCWLASSACVW